MRRRAGQNALEIPDAALKDLRRTLGWLVERRWPFRVHATCDETIGKYVAARCYRPSLAGSNPGA